MAAQIRQQISTHKQKVQETGAELDRCRQVQEAFSVEYYTFREKNVQFESFVEQHGEQHPDAKKFRASKETMEKDIRNKYLALANQRQGLINNYVAIYQTVKEIQAQVLDKELIRWKREQQLAGNGHTMSFNLETLQEW